jgi:hypothetical protein
MGAIRKALCLLFAIALVGGGLYLLIRFAIAGMHPAYEDYANYIWMMGTTGAMMVFLGVYWLWTDFVKPGKARTTIKSARLNRESKNRPADCGRWKF